MIKYNQVRYMSVSIELEPQAVYVFASNPENLPLWAAGLGLGVKRAGEHWEVITEKAQSAYALHRTMSMVCWITRSC